MYIEEILAGLIKHLLPKMKIASRQLLCGIGGSLAGLLCAGFDSATVNNL